jgi:hypothetical protein
VNAQLVQEVMDAVAVITQEELAQLTTEPRLAWLELDYGATTFSIIVNKM